MRWPSVLVVGAVIIVVWGGMSAMRGGDIRNYEGGMEELSPGLHAQGALDIYSMTAVVVESFPAKLPYTHGESLVPLVFGWVPRPLWPNKPYPFSLYMNTLNGETLQQRTASIAVGLTGEGYGNFGLFGAFLWGSLLGFGCRAGDGYLSRFQSSNPLKLLLGCLALVWVAMIVRGGVPEMFYMGLQIIIVPLLLSWFLFHRQHNMLPHLIRTTSYLRSN